MMAFVDLVNTFDLAHREPMVMKIPSNVLYGKHIKMLTKN